MILIKQTLGLFIVDKIKGILITTSLVLPLFSALTSLNRWGGDTVIFTSVFIMLLVNKFTPLKKGSLKTRIESLASPLNFPLTNLFVCDGSKRSSHSNAYLQGFFNSKRIVIYDILLNQVNDDEVLAVLGHELGHWKCGTQCKVLSFNKFTLLPYSIRLAGILFLAPSPLL
ncbi:CAAX prenyl protease 1 [Thraustotheca clavata]|uniref:Ste24 endopeptidase n=1 Tax=Thraustotheca clavata TaxID=74557 RepID=A0A1V9YTG0_9STRA|nr:CAAX prenyl protease 1 [Thraustotheca clavata]